MFYQISLFAQGFYPLLSGLNERAAAVELQLGLLHSYTRNIDLYLQWKYTKLTLIKRLITRKNFLSS